MAEMTEQEEQMGARTSIARHAIRETVSKLLNRYLQSAHSQASASRSSSYSSKTPSITFNPYRLPPRPQAPSQKLPSESKVCIIGAGIAGLYTALMLDYLNIPYDILEASDRPGGRIRTHYFSDKPHDYYDIGAMRFPQIPPMERTFDLFERTQVPLVDYHVKGPANPKRYNGITIVPDKEDVDMKHDPFHVAESNGGNVPDRELASVQTVVSDALEPLRNAIMHPDAESYRWIKEWDRVTIREFLRDKLGLDYHTVHWLEDTDRGTGTFEMGLTEFVTESFTFNYNSGEAAKWKSIDGGTEVLTARLADKIKSDVTYNKYVTRVALDRKTEGEDRMEVTCNHDEAPQRYSTVISTTTLGALQRVDTSDLEFSSTLQTAIRALRYDNATKVAIKFSHAWWVKLGIVEAGAAHTDLPIRTCIYPSQSVDDDPNEPAVLLCTYTWGQDAHRMGALVNSKGPYGQEALKGLLLNNLARLHSHNDDFEQVHTMLKESYITHHGFDWTADDFASGAVARFSAGQFCNFYPHLVQPHADSRFHIVGEAASANHAWIAGSLNSAYRGVWCFLERFHAYDLQERLQREFGSVPELETGERGVAHLLVALGKLRQGDFACGTGVDVREKEEEERVVGAEGLVGEGGSLLEVPKWAMQAVA